MKTELSKQTEKYLYDYEKNLACLEVSNYDLEILKNSIYSTDETVVSRADKIEKLKSKIDILKKQTEPVTKLLRDLQGDKYLLSILRLYYFGLNKVDVVADYLHISRRYFFYKRKDLILMAIKYFNNDNDLNL